MDQGENGVLEALLTESGDTGRKADLEWRFCLYLEYTEFEVPKGNVVETFARKLQGEI